jgi:hypothetical protein
MPKCCFAAGGENMHEYIKKKYFYFNSEGLIKEDYEKGMTCNTYEENEKLMQN